MSSSRKSECIIFWISLYSVLVKNFIINKLSIEIVQSLLLPFNHAARVIWVSKWHRADGPPSCLQGLAFNYLIYTILTKYNTQSGYNFAYKAFLDVGYQGSLWVCLCSLEAILSRDQLAISIYWLIFQIKSRQGIGEMESKLRWTDHSVMYLRLFKAMVT